MLPMKRRGWRAEGGGGGPGTDWGAHFILKCILGSLMVPLPVALTTSTQQELTGVIFKKGRQGIWPSILGKEEGLLMDPWGSG